MAHDSKRYKALRGKVEHMKLYPVQDALKIIKDNATAKFNESVDVSINLGIDAKKSDQAVRGSIVLPQGTGKTVRVAVFAQGDKAQQARDAGADIVGFDDLATDIKGGKMDFDVVIATPDAMRVVGQLGPDPRSARLDAEPEGRHRDAGRDAGGKERQGRVRCSTAPTRPASCSARSAARRFTVEALEENFKALVDAVNKPAQRARKACS